MRWIMTLGKERLINLAQMKDISIRERNGKFQIIATNSDETHIFTLEEYGTQADAKKALERMGANL